MTGIAALQNQHSNDVGSSIVIKTITYRMRFLRLSPNVIGVHINTSKQGILIWGLDGDPSDTEAGIHGSWYPTSCSDMTGPEVSPLAEI